MAEQNVAPTIPDLFQFAFFPYQGPPCSPAEAVRLGFPNAIATLAELSEPEDWSGQVNNTAPYGILKSYIVYTYRRFYIEQKISISRDNQGAAFNTGLLTPFGEELFGYFEPNRRPKAQPWVFYGWKSESDMGMMNRFYPPPEMAQYVRTAAELVYDTGRPLTISIDHIIQHNIERFPPELRKKGMEGMARMCLNSAKDMTLKRLRRNYKIAIPQWYPKLGTEGAQLMLPLDLTNSGTADLALVVSLTDGGSYRGHTVLTLGMAYSNARLVARPDSAWLRPQVANEVLEEVANSI
ncbi:hypothetical protein H2200_005636 [Cladophialophora chaetospira]|uniref:DUF3825 domain-containing protein n=1 Tax=Cladophialophora chaetospira TaxID=386627 RepID=A0AA39CJ40_9EURO|nr:hypothetical protein H2200_005636 [Cladophialophora chaetospira]